MPDLIERILSRLIVFIGMLTVYALKGEIQRIGDKIFLATPPKFSTDGKISELVTHAGFNRKNIISIDSIHRNAIIFLSLATFSIFFIIIHLILIDQSAQQHETMVDPTSVWGLGNSDQSQRRNVQPEPCRI